MSDAVTKMPCRTSAPVDTSELTDTDWVAINEINRAYEARGRMALNKALADLKKADPKRYLKIAAVYEVIFEITTVSMVEAELIEDALFQKTKNPAGFH